MSERLGAIGIATVSCDLDGRLEPGQDVPRGDKLIVRLLQESPLVAENLRRAARRWSHMNAPVPDEIVPGLWVCAMPRLVRRRASGYTLAVIPTFELVRSEHLAAMCQSAEIDFQLANDILCALPPAAVDDVPRLAALVRFSFDDQHRIASEHQSTESLGQQLAESYEEINLLYTIIGNMTVREQPERFLQVACDELLATLPYQWIAVALADEPGRLRQMAGRLLVAGEPLAVGGDMRRLMGPLLGDQHSHEPRVFDPLVDPAHAGWSRLGRPIMTHPIVADGRVIALLAAGDKCGEDQAVSSVDQKLLGACASNMAIFLENWLLVADLNSMFLGTLEALTASIDAKDRYTCGHSRRVALLTRQLARAIGLDEHTIERMHIAGLVHDVGKIGVPESVLLKPGRLNDEEFEWIRRHPEMGYRILRDIPQLEDVLPGVLHHHERWDGRGYPHGLEGGGIPLVARLIGLADSFDAMSSTRTYRPAMEREQVLEEIVNCRGTQFDPELVPHFVNLDFSEYDRRVREDQAAEEQGSYVPLTELREFNARGSSGSARGDWGDGSGSSGGGCEDEGSGIGGVGERALLGRASVPMEADVSGEEEKEGRDEAEL